MSDTTSSKLQSYAAIDLGSNSFHMVIAQLEGQTLRMVDRLREAVRLGSGLDDKKRLAPETLELAMACLGQFEQRLRGIPRENIRIVGTNTLRRAKNTGEFFSQARQLLGKDIEVISGREEARLIYSAVAHSQPTPETRRLVIDIGGGSTELIIGTGYKPSIMESTNMGCVSFSEQYFPSGEISKSAMQSAILHAELELQPILRAYKDAGWEEAIGCSGTIKATLKALREQKLCDDVITRQGLKELCDIMINAGKFETLNLSSINTNRRKVIVGGIAVLYAVMRSLEIDALKVSQVALREGVIYDMIGKAEHDDAQEQTIQQLLSYYRADEKQSERVSATAQKLFSAVQNVWKLDPDHDLNTLIRASQLHEIGLSVAHHQYHKHAAYLLQHSDMLGFSRTQQNELALLVRYHRRKLDTKPFTTLDSDRSTTLLKLLALLRVAVLFHRDRYTHEMPTITMSVKKSELQIAIPQEWMEDHPLTAVELVEEKAKLKSADIKLKLVTL
ncbi:MAG TPA: exopolyphosphatase [Gammaproteobacteria bacterium]|jgi:exopolyphosphatase/guanosine-5'-triphosphate,3'-diphosphate pyrophosphatase|nr:exopolyphosphatase [Gammaproteobacteria bacterium]